MCAEDRGSGLLSPLCGVDQLDDRKEEDATVAPCHKQQTLAAIIRGCLARTWSVAASTDSSSAPGARGFRAQPPVSGHCDLLISAGLMSCRVSLGSVNGPLPQFRSTILRVEVVGSALRHGVELEDIQHALVHALAVDQVGEDPDRYLVLGPDRSANLLELIVLDRPHGPAVIHAMPMRPQYRNLLPGGR
jgi:hypothetical protein